MRLVQFALLYRTVRYLKIKQIVYRIYYTFRRHFRKWSRFHYDLTPPATSYLLTLAPSIQAYPSYHQGCFTFLKRSHTFETQIDWNFNSYGKLWTYNLTYFDFLHQPHLTPAEGLRLMHDFIERSHTLKDGLEPFPISLRTINWIKFLTVHRIQDSKIESALLAHFEILSDNLEYHLLGNHLLENAFSLLYGSYYFRNTRFYTRSKAILLAELAEQILPDGGHFERSPMYHQIILYRLLECINLVQNNLQYNQELLPLFSHYASLMLGWIKTITYTDGTIPMFNDSAEGIAPSSATLMEYADRLEIACNIQPLKSSGYRKILRPRYECVVDVGDIGPDYIPGHAHSDTFSFELHLDHKPLIVDTGTSTYETNQRRMEERSTYAHNSVVFSDKEQSEVWGGFRVGRRAKIIRLNETDTTLSATHDGYKEWGVYHTRTFSFETNRIVIEDALEGNGRSFLHCHPDVSVTFIENDNTIMIDQLSLKWSGATSVTLKQYQYAKGFNTLIEATLIQIDFNDHLHMELIL